MRLRHPHVFAGGDARSVDEVIQRWEEIKKSRKPTAKAFWRYPGETFRSGKSRQCSQALERRSPGTHSHPPDTPERGRTRRRTSCHGCGGQTAGPRCRASVACGDKEVGGASPRAGASLPGWGPGQPRVLGQNRYMAVTSARGMRDFAPRDKERRDAILAIIGETYHLHGFEAIETPALEDSSVLHSGMGGDNEKLAFQVLKRGLETADLAGASDPSELSDLGLRFDLTVPLARFYATHHASLPPVFRAFHTGPVWRAERPQKRSIPPIYSVRYRHPGGGGSAGRGRGHARHS